MPCDEVFMRAALEQAMIAFQKGEVPVGAVLVHKGEIIARCHNQVESRKDPTAHAELLCLQEGAKVLDNWRLLDAILYVTLEPCAMCTGALYSSRIKEVVYGAPDHRQGALGSWVNLRDRPHEIHNFVVKKGVCAEESAFLLKDFFQKRRQEARNGRGI